MSYSTSLLRVDVGINVHVNTKCFEYTRFSPDCPNKVGFRVADETYQPLKTTIYGRHSSAFERACRLKLPLNVESDADNC